MRIVGGSDLRREGGRTGGSSGAVVRVEADDELRTSPFSFTFSSSYV